MKVLLPVIYFLFITSAQANIRNFLLHSHFYFSDNLTYEYPLSLQLRKIYHDDYNPGVHPMDESDFYDNRIILEQDMLDEALDFLGTSYRYIKTTLDRTHKFRAFGFHFASVRFFELDRQTGVNGQITLPAKFFTDKKPHSFHLALKYDDSIKKWIPYFKDNLLYKVHIKLNKSLEEINQLKVGLRLLSNHPKIETIKFETFTCDKVNKYYDETTGHYDHNDSLPRSIIKDCKGTQHYQHFCKRLTEGELYTGSESLAQSCGTTVKDNNLKYFFKDGTFIVD